MECHKGPDSGKLEVADISESGLKRLHRTWHNPTQNIQVEVKVSTESGAIYTDLEVME